MLADFAEFERFLNRCTNYERVPTLPMARAELALARMAEFAAEIGSPQLACPSIHVAGTKGKGSTSLILEALLRSEGWKLGTYTSPHVENLRERIRLEGAPIGEHDLLREVNRLFPALEARRALGEDAFPTFFELMTALAMTSFKSHRVDRGIFEVGLGGRLDATNILRPQLTAITSIGLEHTQQLGDTLAKIAREKAGIVKEGTLLVLGPVPDEARREILQIAAARHAPVVEVDPASASSAGPGSIDLKGLGVVPAGPVLGPALRTDLALAVELLRQTLAPEGKTPSRERIAAGLASLHLPARVERFGGDPEVILDAAHTADSVRALRLTLEEIGFPRPRTLVFSVASGKDLPGILGELPRIGEEIIWTLADPIRSIPPETLRAELGIGQVVLDPTDALRAAQGRGHPVVVTGSFYLAGALRPKLRALTASRV